MTEDPENLDPDKNRSIIKTLSMPDPVIDIRFPSDKDYLCNHSQDADENCTQKAQMNKQAKLRKKNSDKEYVRSLRMRELSVRQALQQKFKE